VEGGKVARRQECDCGQTHPREGGHREVPDGRLQREGGFEKYLTGGFNEKAVAYQITHGKHAMPLFAERLSKTEVGVVAVYVIKSAEDGWD